MSARPTRYILLTGAGFSKNWGGYLASEIWQRLLADREIQADTTVRHKLLSDGRLNYEDVLGDLQADPGLQSEQTRLEDALLRVFERQDQRMAGSTIATKAGRQGFAQFLKIFCREHGGCVFTLNQDLLLERYATVVTPGVPPVRDLLANQRTHDHDREIDANQEPTFDNHGLVYVKLHGSFNWRTNTGNRLLISGTRKNENVDKFPILRSYQQMFEEECKKPGTHLVIVGYGFLDDHINKTIAAGANKGLRISIVDVGSARDLRKRLFPGLGDGRTGHGTTSPGFQVPIPYGSPTDIWNALVGYYGDSLDPVLSGGIDEAVVDDFYASLGIPRPRP